MEIDQWPQSFPPRRSLRLATPADGRAVTELRISAYRRSTEFTLDDDAGVGWGALDVQSVVATAWEDAELLSTLRATLVEHPTRAEEVLTCSVDVGSDAFPAVVLTKAATRAGRGSAGLHSALRYHLIQAAADAGLKSVLGMVYVNAPRVRTMTEIGYELRSPDRMWDPEGKALSPPLFAVLSADRFARAISVLLDLCSGTLAEFPWVGSSPSLSDKLIIRAF